MVSINKGEIAIKWSPFVDEDFILVGSSVNLYRLTSIDSNFKSRNENNLYVSINTCAKLIGSINNYPNEKLIAWNPCMDFGFHIVALYEDGSSQIRIVSLDQEDRPNLPVLNIGSAKKCNQIEWNLNKSTLLGLGFEKSENTSLGVWDLYQPTAPTYQLDEYETCYSFAWNPQSSDYFFASFENRISLFDLRANRSSLSLKTSFIHGFTIDPKNTDRAASYDENNKIALWDLRMVREPDDLIEESKQIKKIQFCPSKSNRLAVLTDNSTSVSVYRLEERNDKLYKEQIDYSKHYQNTTTINSFSWHSKDWNKLMTSFLDPYLVLKDYMVSDYTPIGLSVNETLNVVSNDKVNSIMIENFDNEVDIGERIKQRALNSYGINDFLSNIELLTEKEQEIKYLWKWLHTVSKLKENGQNYYGVFSVLNAQTINSNNQLQDFNDKKDYILKLCGWYDWIKTVEKLESDGEYERAACIAVFNNGIDRAIEILKNASNKNNSNEYLALSLPLRFYRSTLNNKESTQILTKLKNPYLKAMFACKIESDYNQNLTIYNDSNILLPDRICMAMYMLKPEQFKAYIQNLTIAFIKEGSLYGILLTGLTFDCIELFQFYINRTGDVQTPAVVVKHATCANTLHHKYVRGWIESYRDLLDCWMLWTQRAQFDIKFEYAKQSDIKEAKVFIRCVSCGQNLSSRRRRQPMIQQTENNANNGMACQSCQKPSLRCSVCSLYMTVDPPKSAFLNKDKMILWFLFCQKCSHGGHLGHLESWFKTNPECPVMNCNCQCYTKDDFFDELN